MIDNAERVEGIRDRIARHKQRRVGEVKKKILLLLAGGFTLGLSGSPATSWKVIGAMAKEWQRFSKQAAERAINSLYASKLVDAKDNKDGTVTLVLSEKGRKKTLTYDLHRMKIKKPKTWDRLWRLVSFDVPVGKRALRDALRGHLLNLGFYELQQSLFIHPFDCSEELEYLLELYDARQYVRVFLVQKVDNESHLKRFFHLKDISD